MCQSITGCIRRGPLVAILRQKVRFKRFHSPFTPFLFPFVCTDIDECSAPFHVCTKPSKGGHCENTKGSYQCSCVRGFTGNGIQIGSKMENGTGLSCSGKRQCCLQRGRTPFDLSFWSFLTFLHHSSSSSIYLK